MPTKKVSESLEGEDEESWDHEDADIIVANHIDDCTTLYYDPSNITLGQHRNYCS